MKHLFYTFFLILLATVIGCGGGEGVSLAPEGMVQEVVSSGPNPSIPGTGSMYRAYLFTVPSLEATGGEDSGGTIGGGIAGTGSTAFSMPSDSDTGALQNPLIVEIPKPIVICGRDAGITPFWVQDDGTPLMNLESEFGIFTIVRGLSPDQLRVDCGGLGTMGPQFQRATLIRDAAQIQETLTAEVIDGYLYLKPSEETQVRIQSGEVHYLEVSYTFLGKSVDHVLLLADPATGLFQVAPCPSKLLLKKLIWRGGLLLWQNDVRLLDFRVAALSL